LPTLRKIQEIIKEAKIKQKINQLEDEIIIQHREVEQTLKSFNKKTYEKDLDSIIDHLTESPIILQIVRKVKKDKITIGIKYDQYLAQFTIKRIPKLHEIKESTDLMKNSILNVIDDKIRKLSQKQSVNLMLEVFGDGGVSWMKEFKLGPPTKDGGRDFSAKLCTDKNNKIEFDPRYGNFVRCIGSLKHYKGKIGPDAVRDLKGTIEKFKVKHGILISTNGFSDDTIKESTLTNFHVFLFDAKEIAKFMINSNIGVNVLNIKQVEPDDDFWIDVETSTLESKL